MFYVIFSLSSNQVDGEVNTALSVHQQITFMPLMDTKMILRFLEIYIDKRYIV